eukprot:s124_g24.t1
MAAAASLPAPLLEKLLCDAMWIRVTLQVHWRHGETYVDEYRDVEGRFHVRREAMCKPGVLCRVEQWRPFIPSLTVRVEGDAVLIRLGQVGVRSRQVTIAVCRRWARAGAAALRSTWRLKVPERFVDVFDRGCATFMRVHAAHFDMVQLRKGVSAPMAAWVRSKAHFELRATGALQSKWVLRTAQNFEIVIVSYDPTKGCQAYHLSSMDWADVPVTKEGTELPELPDRHTWWPVVRLTRLTLELVPSGDAVTKTPSILRRMGSDSLRKGLRVSLGSNAESEAA